MTGIVVLRDGPCTSMLPSPGSANTLSTTTAPRKVVASSMPRIEMTGTAALRRPCRHIASPNDEPSARDVRR